MFINGRKSGKHGIKLTKMTNRQNDSKIIEIWRNRAYGGIGHVMILFEVFQFFSAKLTVNFSSAKLPMSVLPS